MSPLFHYKCSSDLAIKLGAIKRVRIPNPYVRFNVYEPIDGFYAHVITEDGQYAWPHDKPILSERE